MTRQRPFDPRQSQSSRRERRSLPLQSRRLDHGTPLLESFNQGLKLWGTTRARPTCRRDRRRRRVHHLGLVEKTREQKRQHPTCRFPNLSKICRDSRSTLGLVPRACTQRSRCANRGRGPEKIGPRSLKSHRERPPSRASRSGELGNRRQLIQLMAWISPYASRPKRPRSRPTPDIL